MSSEQERDDLCLQKIYEWYSGSESFIHFACRNGMLKVVKWLIDCKADLNVFDDEKFTPLHRMAIVGNIEMVNVLLENGADIDVPDGRWGCSPLLFAAQEGKMEIVKILLTAGANINFKNNSKLDAIYFASERGHYDIVKILMKFGILINPKCIHNASANGQIALIELLLDYGIDVNSKTQTGNSCLHIAVFNDRIAAAKFLISRGADVNSKGKSKQTSLHCAASGGQIEIVKLLLENGADINSLDKNKDTPLHHAINSENPNIETIKVLLDHGADFKKRNNSGKSVIDLFKQNRNGKDIMDLIVSKMMNSLSLQDSLENDPKPVQFTLEECVICDGRRKEIFSLLPCGHAKTCEVCCLKLIASHDINPVCPICRNVITDYKKIYF